MNHSSPKRLCKQLALRTKNYVVETAFDGKDALDRMTSDFFDLVVLDIMLPAIDGIESGCARRAIGRRGSRAIILMLTARHALESKEEKLGQRRRRLSD